MISPCSGFWEEVPCRPGWAWSLWISSLPVVVYSLFKMHKQTKNSLCTGWLLNIPKFLQTPWGPGWDLSEWPWAVTPQLCCAPGLIYSGWPSSMCCLGGFMGTWLMTNPKCEGSNMSLLVLSDPLALPQLLPEPGTRGMSWDREHFTEHHKKLFPVRVLKHWGCPERLLRLCPWEYSTLASGDPAWSRGAGAERLQRSLPASAVLVLQGTSKTSRLERKFPGRGWYCSHTSPYGM